MLQICSEWKSFFLKSTSFFCGNILWNGVFCSFWLTKLTAELQLWEIHFIENHSKRGTSSNGKEKQNLPWNGLHFDRTTGSACDGKRGSVWYSVKNAFHFRLIRSVNPTERWAFGLWRCDWAVVVMVAAHYHGTVQGCDFYLRLFCLLIFFFAHPIFHYLSYRNVSLK